MTRPLLLFAPGAGAPASSGWMRAWARRLGEIGDVVPFDYPYLREGRRRPDRHPTLVQAHREALAAARQQYAGPAVLVGKSMGSRIGCHLALEEPVAALVCLGYPLRAAGTGKLRDEVLVALRTPILFAQGTRDTLCPLELLEDVRQRMTAPNVLHVVEGGDHSLSLSAGFRRESGTSQEDSDRRVLQAIGDFLGATLAR